MSKIIPNGVYANLSNADYHANTTHFSSSSLKMLLEDPKKFHSIYELKIPQPQEQKNVYDEGSYAHSLILEPDKIASEYAFYDGLRKAGEDFAAFAEANKGKIILSKPQKLRIEHLVESYKRHPFAANFLSTGIAELSIFGQLEGIPIKVRADFVDIENGFILDVKTTGNAGDVETFKDVTMEKFSYPLSASLYLKMFEQQYGKKFEFFFLVLSKKEQTCDIYKLSNETRNKGNKQVSEALRLYRTYKRNESWEIEDTVSEKRLVSNIILEV